MDQAEVRVGWRMMEEGWPRAVEPCGGAPRWHGRISDNGKAIAVPLMCAWWRGRRGEAGGASELAQEGR